MSDDQAPPAETPQTPVSDGLANSPVEPMPEPAPEAVAPPPQSKAAEPTPRTQGVAASTPSAASGKTPEQDRELLKIARAKIQTKKNEKLEKIMTLFEKKEKITNNDVEKLLHCSDATARRYLNELIKQGKLKRIGKTGKAVTYTKL